MPEERMVLRDEIGYVVHDTSPATPLHCLVLPRRHVASYFDLTDAEMAALHRLLAAARSDILRRDPAVEGFNVGINVGEVAGQTIFHCHVHLIPRRLGDVPNPRGGVRAVIPGKAHY
jgi:diadenosine tetraphosphate (Ap4A) HIT family hydrolase